MYQNGDCFTWITGVITITSIYEMSFLDRCSGHLYRAQINQQVVSKCPWCCILVLFSKLALACSILITCLYLRGNLQHSSFFPQAIGHEEHKLNTIVDNERVGSQILFRLIVHFLLQFKPLAVSPILHGADSDYFLCSSSPSSLLISVSSFLLLSVRFHTIFPSCLFHS